MCIDLLNLCSHNNMKLTKYEVKIILKNFNKFDQLLPVFISILRRKNPPHITGSAQVGSGTARSVNQSAPQC